MLERDPVKRPSRPFRGAKCTRRGRESPDVDEPRSRSSCSSPTPPVPPPRTTSIAAGRRALLSVNPVGRDSTEPLLNTVHSPQPRCYDADDDEVLRSTSPLSTHSSTTNKSERDIAVPSKKRRLQSPPSDDVYLRECQLGCPR